MTARMDEAAWAASADATTVVPDLIYEAMTAVEPSVPAVHVPAHAVSSSRRWAWVLLVAAVAVAVLVGVAS